MTDPGGNIVHDERARPSGSSPCAERGGEEAQRVVQANDAHFSSFVSNLFFEADDRRRAASIGLIDPRTGIALPVEAISGKIVSEHGEVTAVVTILHDRTEALEHARLYEELKKASAELERKVREATAELVRQNELLRRSAHRARAGLRAEVAVPGQHVARVPHAAQRHPRLHEHAAARACRAS